MDRLVYTALSGLRRTEFAQAVTAHNLANASTAGFRRDTSAFESQWLTSEAFGTRVQASGQLMGATLEGGAVQTTGRPLDIALAGPGMIAVGARDSGEAYTRRGDLKVAPGGALMTGDNRPVLGEGGPITLPPFTAVEIGADGTVSYRAPGDAESAPMNEAGRIKLVAATPASVRKAADGLFRSSTGIAAAADPSVRLQPGAIEGSNVSPVASMAELIEQSRGFEVQSKLVAEVRDLDSASAQLMRIDN